MGRQSGKRAERRVEVPRRMTPELFAEAKAKILKGVEQGQLTAEEAHEKIAAMQKHLEAQRRAEVERRESRTGGGVK